MIMNAGDAGGIALALRQGDVSAVVLPRLRRLVDGALLGEEGQQALLNGIAVVMAAEDQLHRADPCRM